jgi:hypothetical protein
VNRSEERREGERRAGKRGDLLHGRNVCPVMSSRNKRKTKDKATSSTTNSIGWWGKTCCAVGSNDNSAERSEGGDEGKEERRGLRSQCTNKNDDGIKMKSFR